MEYRLSNRMKNIREKKCVDENQRKRWEHLRERNSNVNGRTKKVAFCKRRNEYKGIYSMRL